ncbi:unnamed protein product, partial [Musa banksii]
AVASHRDVSNPFFAFASSSTYLSIESNCRQVKYEGKQVLRLGFLFIYIAYKTYAWKRLNTQPHANASSSPLAFSSRARILVPPAKRQKLEKKKTEEEARRADGDRPTPCRNSGSRLHIFFSQMYIVIIRYASPSPSSSLLLIKIVNRSSH